MVEHGPSPDFDPEAYDEDSRLRERRVEVDSGGGLTPVLAAIRADWPELREITARMPYQPGKLMLGLEPPLNELVVSRLPEEGASGRFLTGFRAFDRINRDLGLRGVQSFRSIPDVFIFWFDPCVDESRAAKRYRSLLSVRYAELNRSSEDGSDLDAFWDGSRWHVVFRNAWGLNCPAGYCADWELSFFVGDSGNVERLDPDLALAMRSFQVILDRRGWCMHKERFNYACTVRRRTRSR